VELGWGKDGREGREETSKIVIRHLEYKESVLYFRYKILDTRYCCFSVTGQELRYP
jgi:hypothetical protein